MELALAYLDWTEKQNLGNVNIMINNKHRRKMRFWVSLSQSWFQESLMEASLCMSYLRVHTCNKGRTGGSKVFRDQEFIIWCRGIKGLMVWKEQRILICSAVMAESNCILLFQKLEWKANRQNWLYKEKFLFSTYPQCFTIQYLN